MKVHTVTVLSVRKPRGGGGGVLVISRNCANCDAYYIETAVFINHLCTAFLNLDKVGRDLSLYGSWFHTCAPEKAKLDLIS